MMAASLESDSSAARVLLDSSPFTKLPVELQLYIGRFAVECDWDFSLIERPERTLLTNHNKNVLAFAHTCHAFHKPLIRHFFQANNFWTCFWDDEAINWLSSSVIHGYTAYIRTLIVHVHRFQGVAFQDIETLWPGLEALEIDLHLPDFTRAEVENYKVDCRMLFGILPRLQHMKFFDYSDPYSSEPRSMRFMNELTLNPGLRARRVDGVAVSFEEIQEDSEASEDAEEPEEAEGGNETEEPGGEEPEGAEESEGESESGGEGSEEVEGFDEDSEQGEEELSKAEN